jgi:hypothetical protein
LAIEHSTYESVVHLDKPLVSFESEKERSSIITGPAAVRNEFEISPVHERSEHGTEQRAHCGGDGFDEIGRYQNASKLETNGRLFAAVAKAG